MLDDKSPKGKYLLCCVLNGFHILKTQGRSMATLEERKRSNNDGNFGGEKWLEHLSHIKSKKKSTYTRFSHEIYTAQAFKEQIKACKLTRED